MLNFFKLLPEFLTNQNFCGALAPPEPPAPTRILERNECLSNETEEGISNDTCVQSDVTQNTWDSGQLFHRGEAPCLLRYDVPIESVDLLLSLVIGQWLFGIIAIPWSRRTNW